MTSCMIVHYRSYRSYSRKMQQIFQETTNQLQNVLRCYLPKRQKRILSTCFWMELTSCHLRMEHLECPGFHSLFLRTSKSSFPPLQKCNIAAFQCCKVYYLKTNKASYRYIVIQLRYQAS